MRIWTTSPERTCPVYDLLGHHLQSMAGIQPHAGKTRVWNRAGQCLDEVEDPGEGWSPKGIKILGTPVGCDEFVQEVVDKRLRDEEKLWQAVHWIPDLQSAWQVLLQCAGPRCLHVIRIFPPSQSIEYARRHDECMKQTMGALLGGLPGEQRAKNQAQQIASLPMLMGGLGLSSARRMAHGEYSASWADALEMIHERVPQVESVIARLHHENPDTGCVGELRVAAATLDRQLFLGRPPVG